MCGSFCKFRALFYSKVSRYIQYRNGISIFEAFYVKTDSAHNILGCSESSCRKRFKFNKYILKFKSSAFQFSFKIGINFPDNPILFLHIRCSF